MNYLSLLFFCILSVEVFLKFNPLFYCKLILITIKKLTYIFLNKKISDHWKEIVIPAYAIRTMKLSLNIFLIFLFLIAIFFILGNYVTGFFTFAMSLLGIIQSVVYIFIYNFLRKLAVK